MENENTNININEENVEKKDSTNVETEKTYSQEEVLKLLQSETDRRVTEALNKQQRKYEKQLSLSKLDGDEREKAEKDNKIAELEEKLNILKELEYNEKYSNENIKNVMKEVVTTYKEPEEVNKEKK